MVKVVKCRTRHDCLWCQRDIPKGTQAKTISQRYAGQGGRYWLTYYFHMDCPIEYHPGHGEPLTADYAEELAKGLTL